MKSAIATSLAVLLSTSAAYADPSDKSPWNGGYVGVHAGVGEGETDVNCVSGCIFPYETSFDTNGPFIGLQIGLNRQISDRLVVGIESDVSFSDISGDTFFGGKAASSSLDMFGTLRGRAGILVTPTTLVYATGGLAWADWTNSFVPDSTRNSFSDVEWGWTVGGGVETFLNDRLSVKVEYLYLDFGSSTHNWLMESALALSASIRRSTPSVWA